MVDDEDAATPPTYGPLRRFVMEHEDRWTFIILYVGLAVVLSLVLSLFWLVVLLAIHIAFEFVTFGPVHRGLRLLGETLWAVKLDVALLLLAFSLALYLDHLFGLLGLRAVAQVGTAARAGTRVATKAAAWTRGIRSTVLVADDAVQVARAAGKRGEAEPEGGARPPWRQHWHAGEWISVGLAFVSFLLVVLSPVLTDHTVMSAKDALLHELQPFP